VTDTGGTTSHPAVLSREFGIPAVVGTSVATKRIRTGDRIRVDGSAGTVDVLEAPGGAPGDSAGAATGIGS
jgi:phosphoenolpyruvate-protein kinase (PTS system EI component)